MSIQNYTNKKPIMILMIGLPASGKSTQAKILSEQFNAKIHASDEIRKELNIIEQTEENCREVFDLLHKRIKNDLKDGNNVIYDATCISYKRRMIFLQELKKIDCEKICYFMATPYFDCVKNNESRENKVPKEVITRMYKNIYVPQYFEGWNKIEIIWNFDRSKYNSYDLFNNLCDISQDNPHHTLTIGHHCLKCAELLTDNPFLFLAGTYHDISKKFCKSFINSKGEKTETAHFYQHHLVSAYMALFYLKNDYRFNLNDKDILEICKLITWHMQFYFIENEQQRLKYENLLGKEFWNELTVLHDADKEAK